MHHDLKIWPMYFDRVSDGSKTFEVRKNDRAYQAGDTVTLNEWDPEPINATTSAPKGYTERKIGPFKIGYVYVLDQSTVVFSILQIQGAKKSQSK